MVSLYAILGAFARRIYGGWLEAYKIIKNRGVQTVIMMSLFLAIYLPKYKWYVALIITAWLQFQFWSRGHGCCFDVGRGKKPDKNTIKRYNERWYHIPCDWLADNGFFPRYEVEYDYCYMLLRYGCPMIPMMLLDWHYILIGLSIAKIYAICWEWQESKVWKFNTKFCGNATNLAEIISGAVVYGGCYLLC
jgi:hypothetical protein